RDGHRQNPSWCLAIMIRYFAPALFAASTHCSGLKDEGLNTDGSAVPSPHSRSMNEFGPKWISTPNSRSCHITCFGDGLTSLKFCSPADAANATAANTASVHLIEPPLSGG